MAAQSEKEILNQLFSDNEKFPVTDAEPNPEVSKDVEPYIEKIEKEIYLSKPIADDYGAPLVSPPAPQQPNIVLPISQSKYTFGLTQKVTESIAWLARWCKRLVKIFGTRISFRPEGGVA